MVVKGMRAVHRVLVDKPVDHMVLGSDQMVVGARAVHMAVEEKAAQMAVMEVNEAVEQMVVGARALVWRLRRRLPKWR